MTQYPFIALEGLDGSGKTTLRKALFRSIALVTGMSPLTVLTANYVDPRAAKTIIAAKRGQSGFTGEHILTSAMVPDKIATAHSMIAPALRNRPVIADRWVISDLIYLSIKYDLPLPRGLEMLAESGLKSPDLTLVLNIGWEQSMQRASSRTGEAVKPGWDEPPVQAAARTALDSVVSVAAQYPSLGNVVSVDAAQAPVEVLRQAWRIMLQMGLAALSFDHAETPEQAGP